MGVPHSEYLCLHIYKETQVYLSMDPSLYPSSSKLYYMPDPELDSEDTGFLPCWAYRLFYFEKGHQAVNFNSR